jgi:hypothetical protein
LFNCDEELHRQNGSRYCSQCIEHIEPCEWDTGEFSPASLTYEDIQSRRTFGVEIETTRCRRHGVIMGWGTWGCTHDYSIAGKEFISPILQGDEGLAEIKRLCDYGAEREWTAESDCGLHVHFGVTNESPEALRSIALAYRLTQDFWMRCVPDHRRNNRMCSGLDYSTQSVLDMETDQEAFDYFCGARDRFQFINWRAYLVHGTVEVRLHQGSLDSVEICNWVKAHARFIDAVSQLSVSQVMALLGDDGTIEVYRAVADLIGGEVYSAYRGKFSSGLPEIDLTSAHSGV